MVKFNFIGDKFTKSNKARCNKTLTIILKAENFYHSKTDFKLELICDDFKVRSISIYATDDMILLALVDILTEHLNVIIPHNLRHTDSNDLSDFLLISVSNQFQISG